jgi:hypothetical protein
MRDDGITLVFLTKGKVAIIDSVDAERILRHKWRLASRGYAARNRHIADGPGPHAVKMHQEILQAPAGTEPDHINRNGLDNRRCNLRVATRSQNSCNRRIRTDNRSGFRGVSREIGRQRWRATIRIDGKTRHLGRFDVAEDAARAYDAAAQQAFGEFAQLNYPE